MASYIRRLVREKRSIDIKEDKINGNQGKKECEEAQAVKERRATMRIDIGYFPKMGERELEEARKEAESVVSFLLKRATKKKVRVLSSGAAKKGVDATVWYEGVLSIESENLKVLVDLVDELSKRVRPGTFRGIGININE